MTPYRQQAIRDVAAATCGKLGTSAMTVYIKAILELSEGERSEYHNLVIYAVAQRERMLELEAFLEKVVNVNAASTEPDAAELSDALGGLAYEAMKLEAQLQEGALRESD